MILAVCRPLIVAGVALFTVHSIILTIYLCSLLAERWERRAARRRSDERYGGPPGA